MHAALAQTASRPSRDFLSRVRATLTLYRSRRALRELDAHILKDIGITRDQALDEVNRALWDAPRTWRM